MALFKWIKQVSRGPQAGRDPWIYQVRDLLLHIAMIHFPNHNLSKILLKQIKLLFPNT